jgi:hypothetical protein
VAVIRDDDEERLSRADELLQQLRQQVEDLKHLHRDNASRRAASEKLRKRSTNQRREPQGDS